MKTGSILITTMLALSQQAMAWTHFCDTKAALVAKLDICVDIFDEYGHCIPEKACPCWRAYEPSVLDAVLDLTLLNAISACVCVDVV
jgi:hypothetical protein